MKLRFIDNESLLTIKNNLDTWAPNFAKDSSDWLEGVLGKSPFKDTKYEVPDFTLDISEDEPSKTETKNVITVYGHLKDILTDSQASDERLWAGMCLGEFWPYVQYRWKIKQKCTTAAIASHFFFNESSRRSLTRNALARLWWIGRLTYDETNADPYWLTRFVCEYSDLVMHALERNQSNNPMIIKAFLRALKDAREQEGSIINTDVMGKLAKYLNLLGGTYILDCLPESVIYNKIFAEAMRIVQEKKAEAQKKEEEKAAKANPTPEKKEKKEKKRFGWFSLR